MAEDVKPWDAVFDRVRVVYRIDWVYPPKPTAEELDRTETDLDFKFPPSYRAFAERFGLDGHLFILPSLLPLRDTPGSDWSVLGTSRYFRTKAHEYWNLPESPPPLFARMVMFAQDSGYEQFVFDPSEVTDAAEGEYRVYSIDKSADITPIGDSFPDFLQWIYNRYRPDPDEAEDWGQELRAWQVIKPEASAPHPIEFDRHCVREKQPPAHEHVKLWLASNNHTARDLALSIRDAGHTDAFPILADALQEAGCTNADLLDACRTGDPDIDGK